MCIPSEGKIIYSYQTAVCVWGGITHQNPSNLSKIAFIFSWVKAVQNINFVGKEKLKKEKILINISISSKSLWNPAGFALVLSWTLNASGFGHKWTQNIKGDPLKKTTKQKQTKKPKQTPKPKNPHRMDLHKRTWMIHLEMFGWGKSNHLAQVPSGSGLGTCRAAPCWGSCRQEREGSHPAVGWGGCPLNGRSVLHRSS